MRAMKGAWSIVWAEGVKELGKKGKDGGGGIGEK